MAHKMCITSDSEKRWRLAFRDIYRLPGKLTKLIEVLILTCGIMHWPSLSLAQTGFSCPSRSEAFTLGSYELLLQFHCARSEGY